MAASTRQHAYFGIVQVHEWILLLSLLLLLFFGLGLWSGLGD